MQIQLIEGELEVAVRDYIKKMGISRPVGNINFTATRGENAGILTSVEVEEEEATPRAEASVKAPAANRVVDIAPSTGNKDVAAAPDEGPSEDAKPAAPKSENSIFG